LISEDSELISEEKNQDTSVENEEEQFALSVNKTDEEIPDMPKEQEEESAQDSESISEPEHLEIEEAQLKNDPITSDKENIELKSEGVKLVNKTTQLKDANIQNENVGLKTLTTSKKLDSKLNKKSETNYSTRDLSTIMQAKLGSCQWIGGKAVIHHVEYSETQQIKNISNVPLSTVVNINNGFFEGKLYIRLKNHGKDQGYFSGRKRINSWTVQGRFKKRLRFDHVWSGQKWDHKWSNLPPKMIMNAGLKFAKKLNPLLHESINSPQPFAIWPLISLPTVLNISKPGEEPDIATHTLKENTKLLKDSKNRPLLKSASHRKDFFSRNPSALKKHYFDTDKVYTFETYQNLFDVLSFTYVLPIKNVSLLNKFQEMPLEFSAFLFQPKDVTNRTATIAQFRKIKYQKDLKFCWRVLLHSKHGYMLNK